MACRCRLPSAGLCLVVQREVSNPFQLGRSRSLWRSWPLVGDATIFHFIAGQFQMGAVPYRDIFDVNMPLTYFIHAAVIAIGGMGDAAWRAFDLTAAVLVSGA